MKERITSILFISFLLFSPVLLFGQALQVSGRVTAKSDGAPLPGVSVIIQGTKTGTSTGADGRFTITVPDLGSVLLFSQIGMQSQQYKVTGRKPINIALTESSSALNEVVVVGYGTQKKSVVTGAISKVTASDFETMPVTRLEQVLQGRTSGLTIAANSGEPGGASTVRVRGITSFNNNDPLWVVDGVVVDNGGIGYLNESDIESVEVLKDAASQAIYGTRAAAGVILVTTKKGKAGRININYNGYYGIAGPARKLDLLDATQYATLRNEQSAADGGGIVFSDPQSLGKGTDWQSLIFNDNAQRQDQEVSISGGSDKATFYSSFGYQNQDGIVATDISKYRQINLRINSTYKPAKWIIIGENVGYSYNKTTGIGNTNSEFGGPLSSAINLDPITPAVVTDPDAANASKYVNNPVRRDALGYPYGISDYVGQEITNPLAYISKQLGNYNWAHNFVGNAFVEVSPVKGLTLRSTLGSKIAFWGNETFTPVFYLNSSNSNSQTSYNRANTRGFNWNIENTVSYERTISKHYFQVLLGQGAYSDGQTYANGVTFQGIPVDNFDDASLNYNVPATQRTATGSEGQPHTIASLFARLNYNFDEKYLVEGIVRRDGSSRFGSNNKYGIFPSFSLGWVPSREDFWPENQVVNFLKIRGGYGVVGSDAINDNAFLSLVSGGRNYSFGTGDSYISGYSPDAPSNPDLKWEQTAQTNIGFDASLLQNFTLTFEWFKKKTTNILQNPAIPGYVGAISNPAANVGSMDNSGWEIELGYRKKLGEVDFAVNGNFSHLHNEVTYIGNNLEYINGANVQNIDGGVTRTAVGHAYNSFYGYDLLGIFQTQEEIDNYTGPNGKIQPNAKPGDFKWADLDGSGNITEADRTFIGDPTPSYQYGLTVSAGYKNFDIVAFGQGSGGNKIFQALRRLDISNSNWQADALSRWTGPGTSTFYPRLTATDANSNFKRASSFYLEDGDYFRIKTLQLGYSLPKSLISKVAMQKARIYVMSENLFTFTKYSGYDPEIGGGSYSIDRGIYPQARSFMVGLNVIF